MYDSSLYRFYSVDPLLQFASPYTYCGNNPILFVDPSGKVSFTVWLVTRIAGHAAMLFLDVATGGLAVPAHAYFMYMDIRTGMLMAKNWAYIGRI